MADTTDEVETVETYYTPTLLLPNARDILNAFGGSIERISARGSRSSKDTVEEDENYGFAINQDFNGSVSLEYTKERNLDGEVENPLTDEKVDYFNNRIHQSLKQIKPDENRNGITYDIPVSRLIIEVQNEDLVWKFGGPENASFYFDFKPIDVSNFNSEFKDIIEPLFNERNLTDQGFNWRILFVHQIIPESGFDFSGNSHSPVYSWDPQNINTEPMDNKTSQRIAGMLPKEISHNKDVKIMEDEYWGL